jgi:HSP20 family protein
MEAAMAVIRYEPFRDPFERLMSLAASGTRAPLAMPMDMYRSDDGSYHIEADLPGADPDSVDVTVEHSTLTIRAERKPHYGETDHVLAAERPHRDISPGNSPSAKGSTPTTSLPPTPTAYST